MVLSPYRHALLGFLFEILQKHSRSCAFHIKWPRPIHSSDLLQLFHLHPKATILPPNRTLTILLRQEPRRLRRQHRRLPRLLRTILPRLLLHKLVRWNTWLVLRPGKDSLLRRKPQMRTMWERSMAVVTGSAIVTRIQF